MQEKNKRTAAKEFAEYWKDKGYEKGQSQTFWLMLLRDVLGVEHPEQIISFEERVVIDTTSFIDAYINPTKVLIEQKSADKDLRKAVRQSDGSLLTPIQQAKKYAAELSYSDRPRWIVTCNFREFLVYDMEHPHDAPESILLENLPKDHYRLQFLVDTGSDEIRKETEISIKAGDLVGVLYDEFLRQYKDPSAESTLKSLNMLCVRLVFCLYAEDSGLFGEKMKFHNYLKSFSVRDARRAVIDLFKVLDTKPEDRDPYLDDVLASFPYVNGGLFADEDIEIPQFNDKIVDILLRRASENFDWSEISPAIFGAVFESTLNPETRRSGGMHYTSIENIHKVIDPLFLDDLKEEFDEIKEIKVDRTRKQKLENFRDKLASLTFLDPACGSGNFLTETYLSLRRLENEALKLIHHDQIVMGLEGVIKVSIGQFYGIEINDFAVTVAKTALWIAESQMMKETEEIVNTYLDFLPLRSYANIVEGNALRMDWERVVPKSKLNYIMGNPPFVGKKYQTISQKNDMQIVFGRTQKGIGSLDYVTAWYQKAAEFIKGTGIEVAYVSTNSLVQGEHIPLFWKPFYNHFDITINFAYPTFKWQTESQRKAAVHCVIIGFTAFHKQGDKWIYFGDKIKKRVNNIHPYLKALPNVFIENRAKPLSSSVAPLVYGSFALDDGNYTISEKEYENLIEKEPDIKKYLLEFLGSEEFINNKRRYCIWLKDAEIKDIRKSRILSEKVKRVQEWRRKSGRKETVDAALTPTLFAEIRQPDSHYLAIPITSSERRRYIPMGYMNENLIASNHLLVLPNATLYEFGVLASNVHMAWVRTVAGRMKSDYNYSARIVYNNFPWPTPTEEQKAKIEQTAQAILDAREIYPDCSLADLYDETTMPVELRHAHQQNDKAVMQAYGFSIKMTESECVAALMKMYQELTKDK